MGNPNILLAAQNSANAANNANNMAQSANALEQNKLNVLSSLLSNQQSVRPLNYGAGNPIRSSLNSPQLNLNNPQNPMELLEQTKQQQQQQQDQYASGGNFFSKEIEEEVEKCIQGLFNKANTNTPGLSVDDFVSIMQKFKDSQEKKDKDFYNYALKYIMDDNISFMLYQLDEMQFHIMSNIWGALIDRNILSPQMLSYCLKILHSMMSKSVPSKHYLFAIKVLDRCKNRLKDFAPFCQYLIQLSNYQELPRSLKEYIEYGVRGSLPPNNYAPNHMASLTPPIGLSNLNQLPPNMNALNQANSQAQLMSLNKLLPGNAGMQSGNLPSALNSGLNMNQVRSLSAKPSIANTTNIETLLVATDNDSTHTKPVAPSEQIQDKISFIFNNLSLSNMTPKSEELKDSVKDDYWEWVAHYLVVKRVSIEPNFHMLYSQFIDVLKKDILNEAILSETYRNIKVLLRSDKNDQKFSDRALLKNLGSWLGLITLAKNRPILHRDVDFKSLIVEAFQKGIPF